jgi:hypothetical protein
VPPSYLKFVDHETILHLVGPRRYGHTAGLGYQHAEAWVTFDYAVEDRDKNVGECSEVHRVRSRIEGLDDLMRWPKTDVDWDGPERHTLVVRRSVAPPLDLGNLNGLHAAIELDFSGGQEGGGVSTIRESTWITTTTGHPVPFEEHLETHAVLRDLVALLYWRPLDFVEHQVRHENAPHRVLSGGAIGPAWRPLHTISPRRSRVVEPAPAGSTAPFDLRLIGPEGVREWFNVRRDWTRAIDPLLGRLFATSATIDVALLQAGVAMESFGFILGQLDGMGKQKAGNRAFKEVVRLALNDLPRDLHVFIDPIDDWADSAANAFTGVKHADKPLPDWTMAWLVAETFTLVLRAHLFRRLGIQDDVLLRLQDWSWHDNGSRLDAAEGRLAKRRRRATSGLFGLAHAGRRERPQKWGGRHLELLERVARRKPRLADPSHGTVELPPGRENSCHLITCDGQRTEHAAVVKR